MNASSVGGGLYLAGEFFSYPVGESDTTYYLGEPFGTLDPSPRLFRL